MKLSISMFALASASSVSRIRKARQVDQGPRRYSQLMDHMNYYNNDFDERQYWTYGCHCFFLGDRPMSDMGKGAPVDALDSVCKQYKECLKCARDEHGEMCIGEFVRYGMRTPRNDEPSCTDDAGSCGRSLCECDKMFAQRHVATVSLFLINKMLITSRLTFSTMTTTIFGARPTGWTTKKTSVFLEAADQLILSAAAHLIPSR